MFLNRGDACSGLFGNTSPIVAKGQCNANERVARVVEIVAA